jgi:hypothetical protein
MKYSDGDTDPLFKKSPFQSVIKIVLTTIIVGVMIILIEIFFPQKENSNEPETCNQVERK